MAGASAAAVAGGGDAQATTPAGGVEGGDTVRARQPDHQGYVGREGERVYYEVFGEGPDPIVFTPADTIVDSRMWKAQVAFLSRHHRVVVIDPRGNGRSDRPVGPEFYGDLTAVDDLVAVMDDCGIHRALLVGLCESSWYGLLAGARQPDRVSGVVAIAPGATEGTPKHDRGIDTAANWSADIERAPGVGGLQRGRLAARLAGVPPVVLLADLQRPAQQQGLRGHRRLGRRHHRRHHVVSPRLRVRGGRTRARG